MRIALATDHAGFILKEAVKQTILECGCEVLDLGINECVKADYPDYAAKVGKAIQTGQADRGIALCGSGVGVCIAANKMKGIYAAVCHDSYTAHQGVEHDGMNVLCLGGRVIGEELAKDIVRSYLNAKQFTEPRFIKRLDMVKALEAENFRG
jgi:ribose 5-phosphate isomerase B